MGLDSVELVIDIEETFAITIADEEAERVQTVGDLHRLILEHLARPVPEPDVLNERVCFHRVRACLREIASVPRSRIRPDARLADLISPAERRATWKKLGDCWGLDLPELRASPLHQATIASSYIVPILALVPLIVFMPREPLIVLVPAIGIAAAFFINISTRGLRRELPPGWGRVSDIIRRMHLRDYPQAARPKLDGPDDVYRLMKERIINQLGVDESEVVPEAHFIDDLRMD